MTVAPQDGSMLEARLQPYLRPGEQLLWCGRPDPAVVFAAADIIAIPFSIIWLGIAIAWEAGVRAAGAPAGFRDFGIPFVLIGIYLLAGRYVTRWFRKRKTVYGITTERVLIQVGSSFRESPVKGGSMAVRRRRSGRHATVVFEPFGSYYEYRPGTMTGPPIGDSGVPTMSGPTRTRVAPGAVTFADVADADALLTAINQAKASPLT
jgi:hypothetical protein